MRDVPSTIKEALLSGAFVGDRRPMVRLTVQRPRIKIVKTLAKSNNIFANLMHSPNQGTPVEVPNVKSVEWERSVDSDVGSCTVTLDNTRPYPIGAQPGRELDQPGYYSYNRGRSTFSKRWDHSPNAWSMRLLPESIIRTFEGYGFDPDKPPEKDPFLVQTGVWMIDEVDYSHQGLIVLSCRDLARVLMDQIIFPPVNPFKAGFVNKDLPKGAYAYPVSFTSVNSEPTFRDVPMTRTGKLAVKYHSDSNTFYVGSSGKVFGHHGRDAFDGNSSSYWLSIGNARGDAGYSFEWVQGSISKSKVKTVRFRTKGAGYTCYLGIYKNGAWQGSKTVPYNPHQPPAFPNDSNRKYVKSMVVKDEGWHEFNLSGSGIDGVERVRLTFSNLWNSGLGTFRYRAAVRVFEVYGGTTTIQRVTTKYYDKNYSDYTDLVKLFAAWGGFFWPPDQKQEKLSDGTTRTWNYSRVDNCLTIGGAGRVWGDFELTGTAGPAPIPASTFDKRPLMDGISYVRDIVGFIFYADEYGGLVWRLPNLFQTGNLMRTLGPRSGVRTTQMITIDERRELESLSAKLSDRNVRERIFVASGDGKFGAMAQGWNPNPIGLRRVGGWSDMHFENNKECLVMADMIALRQLFSYRTDSATIPANPALQVDDQVRIYERVTNEGYIHYVKGIKSSNDLENGQWVYELQTHWLGEHPFKRWVFHPTDLSAETQRYLKGIYQDVSRLREDLR